MFTVPPLSPFCSTPLRLCTTCCCIRKDPRWRSGWPGDCRRWCCFQGATMSSSWLLSPTAYRQVVERDLSAGLRSCEKKSYNSLNPTPSEYVYPQYLICNQMYSFFVLLCHNFVRQQSVMRLKEGSRALINWNDFQIIGACGQKSVTTN